MGPKGQDWASPGLTRTRTAVTRYRRLCRRIRSRQWALERGAQNEFAAFADLTGYDNIASMLAKNLSAYRQTEAGSAASPWSLQMV